MNAKIPFDGLKGLKAHTKEDLTSGFLVFLIALPLCLGISMASGFPPFAGIITAMVGGLIVSPIMGSRLSIKGPAAGLISIAVAAVADLGNGDMAVGYTYALAVVVLTGVIQVAFALLKLGRYVDFFPTSAVHGMLAAIGIIIIAKQLPVLLGTSAVSKNPIGILLELPHLIQRADAHDAEVGLVSLA
ncbi:MAG: SulP family inorganic anion transporter, partial [Schleiferiaceae bacterium]